MDSLLVEEVPSAHLVMQVELLLLWGLLLPSVSEHPLDLLLLVGQALNVALDFAQRVRHSVISGIRLSFGQGHHAPLAVWQGVRGEGRVRGGGQVKTQAPGVDSPWGEARRVLLHASQVETLPAPESGIVKGRCPARGERK